MNAVEKITHNKKLVAVVIKNKAKIHNLKFFTDINSPIQVALHSYKNNKETRLHSYTITKPIKISEAHKFIYVVKGKIKITLFSKSKKPFKIKNLKAGDSIIVMDISHKVNFIGTTKVFEVKQGPYLGQLID